MFLFTFIWSITDPLFILGLFILLIRPYHPDPLKHFSAFLLLFHCHQQETSGTWLIFYYVVLTLLFVSFRSFSHPCCLFCRQHFLWGNQFTDNGGVSSGPWFEQINFYGHISADCWLLTCGCHWILDGRIWRKLPNILRRLRWRRQTLIERRRQKDTLENFVWWFSVAVSTNIESFFSSYGTRGHRKKQLYDFMVESLLRIQQHLFILFNCCSTMKDSFVRFDWHPQRGCGQLQEIVAYKWMAINRNQVIGRNGKSSFHSFILCLRIKDLSKPDWNAGK